MLANALEFDSGVIPVIPWKTITVTNNNDSGPGSLRNAVAAAQDKPTEYFNGSNGVLTVAQITFSGAGEQDILTGGGYSDRCRFFTRG